MYALGYHLQPGHKSDWEIGWNRVTRTYDEDRSAPASDQSIYGRLDFYNYIGYGAQPWKLIKWVRMKFKPAKSRSFVMKKGKTADLSRFSLSGTTIPNMPECPVKSQGKFFNCTLRDNNVVRTAVGDLELWLARVNKSDLFGHFKAWLYQHAVLPRILCPLFVFDSD